MKSSRIILLADMESFYASVEVAGNPSLRGKPVAVCGDPERRHGVVLAATKEAKAFGVKTGMAAGECTRLCPNLIFVRPHMREYINTSLALTRIFEEFSDLVSPYSIDEQFLDITGCKRLFGDAETAALRIIERIWSAMQIRCRVGIGENPLQAKMACDCFAKKNERGIFRLSHENYAEYTWPLPIRKLFGVGNRMERNLFNIGVRAIGHLALLSRENLKARWGINGEILWFNAHGIDHSVVKPPGPEDRRKGVGHSITLPRDYRHKEEINTVLLEITEEVCRRTRILGKAGRVVNVYCRGADFDLPTGFSRQKRLPEPTAMTMEVYPFVQKVFYEHWDLRPVRSLGISLTDLMDFEELQLSLLEDKEKKIALSRTMDLIRDRFGIASLFRLSSLTYGGLLFERASKIGGHEA